MMPETPANEEVARQIVITRTDVGVSVQIPPGSPVVILGMLAMAEMIIKQNYIGTMQQAARENLAGAIVEGTPELLERLKNNGQ
jgi:hypothetical protein